MPPDTIFGWNVAWLVNRDLIEVLAIEKLSFKRPWLPGDWKRLIREKYTLAQVVRDRANCKSNEWGTVVGCSMTRKVGREVQILRLAVDPDYRRQNIGRAMVGRIQDKAAYSKRIDKIVFWLTDELLDSACFFGAVGFKMVEEKSNDGAVSYKFEYHKGN